jgi:hypothetical protein
MYEKQWGMWDNRNRLLPVLWEEIIMVDMYDGERYRAEIDRDFNTFNIYEKTELGEKRIVTVWGLDQKQICDELMFYYDIESKNKTRVL